MTQERKRRRRRKGDARFGAWLSRVIDECRVSPIGEFCRRVVLDPNEVGLDERDLFNIRRGIVCAKDWKVFAIGEALHAYGIAWCSGPLALFQSTHLPAFVDCLAALGRRDALALIRAVAPPLNDDGSLPAAYKTAIDDIRKRRVEQQLAACYSDDYGRAWALARGSSMAVENERDAPPELKPARILAASGDRARMVEALVDWADASANDDELYRGRAAAFALAHVASEGPERAKYLAELLRTRAESIERQTIGVGRHKDG